MKVELDSPRVMNEKVSSLPGVVAEVSAEASRIAGRARARLAVHKPGKDGRIGPSNISVTHGRTDSFVNLDDENAMSIEFGAPHRGEPGLYILTGASGWI